MNGREEWLEQGPDSAVMSPASPEDEPAALSVARRSLTDLRDPQGPPVSPVELYGQSLAGRCSTRLRYADGHLAPLDVPRWTSVSAAGDNDLLSRCRSATLDVGCGPGRLLRALLGSGTACTGVDVAPVAVQLARASGAKVLHASVQDAVLDGTRWSTVLLADGNIGIGGNPIRLLRRAGELLRPGGTIVTELGRPGTGSGRVRVRLEAGDQASSWFSWALVAADDAAHVAGAAGLQVAEAWQAAGRHFASLALPSPRNSGGGTAHATVTKSSSPRPDMAAGNPASKAAFSAGQPSDSGVLPFAMQRRRLDMTGRPAALGAPVNRAWISSSDNAGSTRRLEVDPPPAMSGRDMSFLKRDDIAMLTARMRPRWPGRLTSCAPMT